MQNNLGNALRRLGEYMRDTTLLIDAKKAFYLSLSVFDRQRFPQDWSRAQSNLASVYQSLGVITEKPQYLLEAVDHFLDALEVREEHDSPYQWGLTQNHLGNTYIHLWKLTHNSAYVNLALLCHVRAWRVLRDDWGHSRDISGNAIWSDLSYVDDNRVILDLGLYSKEDSAALWHFRPQIRNPR
jgi:tetratricopeptide (TPR) repeat protein